MKIVVNILKEAGLIDGGAVKVDQAKRWISMGELVTSFWNAMESKGWRILGWMNLQLS